MDEQRRISVGKLSSFDFPAGTYVYVGSALSGIEQRVSRHKSSSKRTRWHIDYLLPHARIVSTVSIPCGGRAYECAVAQTLLEVEDAAIVAEGFGSSDCGCPSHLIYLGNGDIERAAESISARLSMLQCVHPRTVE